jgi:hypothetical protein
LAEAEWDMTNNRLICDRAVYDWSFNDPRTLVYFCQQRMRGDLLDKAAAEQVRYSWLTRSLGSVVSVISAIIAGRPLSEPTIEHPVAVPSAVASARLLANAA